MAEEALERAFAERRASAAAQFARLQENKSMWPYIQLSPGPTTTPCPLHAGEYDWLYFVDSPYWQQKPLRSHESCLCGVVGVRRREADKIQRQGLTVRGASKLNADGTPTGHNKLVRVPLRGFR